MDLRDSFQRAQEEAFEPAPSPLPIPTVESDPKAPRVTRRMTFRVRCLAPETNEPLETDIVSVVPDGAKLDALARDVARRSGGVAWSLKPLFEYQRALMLATVLVQCEHLDEWVWTRVNEDLVFLTLVYGGLAEHQAGYFRHQRNPETGQVDTELSGMARGPLTPG